MSLVTKYISSPALISFFLLFAFFQASPVHADTIPSACTGDIDGKTEIELEQILAQCEQEINAQKALLKNTQQVSASLQQAITDFTSRIKQAELEIKARSIKIRQIGDTIVVKNDRILSLSERLAKVQGSIGELVRKSAEYDTYSPIETFLSNQDLSAFFADTDSFVNIRDELRKTFLELKEVKQLTEKEKKDLEVKKADEQELKFTQEQQKRQAENIRLEKTRVLAVTKGQEEAYKKDIAEKERLKNEIRNRIFRTVGGTELKFGEALKLIQPYEARIGVDSALILAVLSQESSINGLIGKNIGKCYYNQTAKNPEGMVMKSDQRAVFESLMASLNMNPNTTPVSCPIYSDGAYGGAMGPAQFMPITWQGYVNRISAVLGIANPSPFDNLSAFTGTALYLADAQSRCTTAFSSKFDIWRCSAAKYYAGLGASGSRLAKNMNPYSSYGYQVGKRAQQFQKDIDTLSL